MRAQVLALLQISGFIALYSFLNRFSFGEEMMIILCCAGVWQRDILCLPLKKFDILQKSKYLLT